MSLFPLVTFYVKNKQQLGWWKLWLITSPGFDIATLQNTEITCAAVLKRDILFYRSLRHVWPHLASTENSG